MEVLNIEEIVKAVSGILLSGDKDRTVTYVSTNSKQIEKDTLFVPIVGERTDGHRYIEDAFKAGAVATFTSKELSMEERNRLPATYAYIKVEDTVEALQALGTYYRSKFSIPVIGITGSVGKTTTKEMVAAALGTKYCVLKTEGNMNSQVGLPLMMLRLGKEHEIAVIEMGISEEGEMERLCRIARPESAILTNIGISHIAQLKTRENIRKEKLNIINQFGDQSVLFLNGNDDLLGEIYEKISSYKEKTQIYDILLNEETMDKLENCTIISFGTKEGLNYRAKDIVSSNETTTFTLCVTKRNEFLPGDGERITLSVLGTHNVHNALVALAVASHYEVPIEQAKEGLKQYQPIAMRGVIRREKGITLIDDTYNASPDSIKGGLDMLLQIEANRRIAVLADVRELGDISKEAHYDLGVHIANLKKEDIFIEEVVTVGEEAKNIAQGIKENNPFILTHSFLNNEEAIAYLTAIIKTGDGMLVKGSRSMQTDEIVEKILS